MRTPRGPRPPLQRPTRVLFDRAAAEARDAGRAKIDTEHIAFAWMLYRRSELVIGLAEFGRTYFTARKLFAEYLRVNHASKKPRLAARPGATAR